MQTDFGAWRLRGINAPRRLGCGLCSCYELRTLSTKGVVYTHSSPNITDLGVSHPQTPNLIFNFNQVTNFHYHIRCSVKLGVKLSAHVFFFVFFQILLLRFLLCFEWFGCYVLNVLFEEIAAKSFGANSTVCFTYVFMIDRLLFQDSQ